jgi:Phosphoserine phosphatase RsbU, N-terminal domain
MQIDKQLDALTRDYRTAFLRYLPRREEAALTSGYELGRSAVTAGVSMLDLTRIHHEILLDVLGNTIPEEIIDVTSSAAEFLLEVLAIYDMTQRRLLSGG